MELVYKTIDQSVKILYTDISLIINNLGINMIAYKPHLKKHKTTKKSIIREIQKKSFIYN